MNNIQYFLIKVFKKTITCAYVCVYCGVLTTRNTNTHTYKHIHTYARRYSYVYCGYIWSGNKMDYNRHKYCKTNKPANQPGNKQTTTITFWLINI